jgi:Zn-dependent protease
MDLVPPADAEEELFQRVRDHLLGRTPPPEPSPEPSPVESAAIEESTSPKRSAVGWLWALAGILTAVAIATSVVSGLFFGESGQTVALLIGVLTAGSLTGLALVAGAFFLARVLVRAFTPKRAEQPTGAPAPPVPASPWRTFLVSLGVFALLAVLVFSTVDAALLIGVLFVHELGHFLGMRYFGYRDVQMFFIPLLGAAVRGEKKGVPAWQETIVLLLGPLPGLLLGCTIYFLDLAHPQPLLRSAAAWLVAINFLNLLPFEPLDGGRICNRLLFSRYRWLEAATLVLATVGLVFVCLQPGWICLGLSAAFAVFVLAPARYKTATAGLALQSRWPDLPADLADLSEAEWRDLFQSTREKFPRGDPKKLAASPKLLADQMKMIHQRALQRPESGPVTLALCSVYLAAIVLGVVTASVTRLEEDAGRLPIRRQMTGTADPVPSPKE